MAKEMLLVVFDFDHTIIDANSDIHVYQLFPTAEERLIAEKKVSQLQSWTDRMQEIFRDLHTHHVQPDDYRRNMQEIPLTPGFAQLISYLHSLPNTDLIVASDSNLVFIDTILKHHHLDHAFKDIFTNPAYFSAENQCLIIEPYGQQTCPTCPANMCKREIVEKYLRSKYTGDVRVVFIGDGHNDICPAKALKANDLACARSGYRMAKELKNIGKETFAAELFEWTDGKQIEDYLREHWLKRVSSN